MKFLKIVLIHLLLAFSNLLFAQQYPVNVNSNLVSPMPSKLSSFYADNVQKFFVTLTNKDLTNPGIPAKLKLTLIGTSAQIVSKVGSEIGIVPILLDAGVPLTLTQQDLAPYFNINNLDFVGGFTKSQYNNAGVLPEGNYAISVQVLDYYNNRPLSKPFSMYGSVFFSQPPMLLSPQLNNTINGQETKMIQFNWAPSHLNNRDVISGGYKYIFTLKELLIGDLNINQAYATATTRLVEEVSMNQFMLNTLVTPLLSGRKYAWTVQVKANNPEAQSTLSNNGISQIWGFKYDDNCRVPTNVNANARGTTLAISWTNSTSGKVSSVRYKEVNGVEYEKQLMPDANNVILDGLLYGKNYEYSLVVKCGSNTLVMDSRQVTVPPKSSAVKVSVKGKVHWSVKEEKSNPRMETIFQGVSNKVTETAIPNNKLGLSTKSNNLDMTLSNCVGTIANKKELKGAKVDLWENDEIIVSGTTNAQGEYDIAVDTGRIVDNQSAKYFLKFSRPDNLPGRDSLDLSKSRTGKDILKKIQGKEVVLSSADYLVIHPIVYTGVNQDKALTSKAGGKVDVFILTNDKKSLPNRILGYTENVSTNESYNGESYALIGTLDNKKMFLPLETFNNDREKLLFKVSLKDYPTQYYSIKSLPDNLQYKIVNIPLDYDPMVKIQGKVYKNVKNDLEGLNKSAVVAYDKSTNKILDGTTTNSDGTYALPYVPFSQVKNLVVYAAPFTEATKAIEKERATESYSFPAVNVQNNTITQDMNYGKIPVDIVYGQALLSATGKAVANATIYYNDERIGKTVEDGFFAFKLSATQKEVEKFKIVCDGKVLDQSQTIRIVQKAFSQWEKEVQTKAYNKTNVNKDKPNSALLNHLITYAKRSNDRHPQTVSTLLDTTSEKLGNYYLANFSLKNTFQYQVIATYKGVRQPVVLQDLEEKSTIPVNTSDTTLLLNPDINRYKVNITPALNQMAFLEIKNLVLNFSPTSKTVTIALTPLVKVAGTVTDKQSNQALDAVTVKVDRLDAQAVSNTEGVFNVAFGETSEAKLIISKEGYFAKEIFVKFDNAESKVIAVQLEKAPGVPITQLAGFEAEIKQQTYIQDSSYKVSGRIMVKSNGVFSLGDQTGNLTFKDILVHVGQDGNARPLADSIVFAESQISGKMFDFAPIDIRKIQLKKKMELRNFTEGVITGVITVKSSTFSDVNKNLPFTFSDATLQMPERFTYIYLFTSGKQIINALNKESAVFNLTFSEADNGYVKTKFLKTGSINVSQNGCSISKNGINLAGNLILPNTMFAANSTVPFKDLQMDAQFDVKDYEVDFSSAPLSVKVKRWNLEIEQIKLIDLSNPDGRGLSFGGKLYLTKKNAKTAEGKNVLTIQTLEIRSKGETTEVTAKFSAPTKGISVKTLTFTPESEDLELAYTDADGFTLQSPGRITLWDPDSKFAMIAKKIFPSTGLEVADFIIKSKNWGVFVALEPNMEFDFKGVKLNVEKAILNTGVDMSIDKMNAYLLDEPAEEGESASSEEFDEADPKVGWAFGVNAEVAFESEDIKGKKGKVATSFVLGNFNNATDFRINAVDLELETSSVEIEAHVKFKLAGDSIGVEGECKAMISDIGIEKATFHYYKIKNRYLAYGGSILVGGLNVAVGPVTMYSLGGGFAYNNQNGTFEAYFTGEGGPLGTTKGTTKAYFYATKLGMLFKTQECGAKPVLIGDVDFFLKKGEEEDAEAQKIGNLHAEVDFCRNTLLVQGYADFDEFIEGVKVKADAAIYITGARGGNKAMFFMAVDAQVDVKGFISAQGQMALGINFDANRPDMPQAVKTLFNNLPKEAKSGGSLSKMTAFYVKVSKTTIKKGDYSFDWGIIGAGVNYDLDMTMKAHLLANFATNSYEVGFGVNVDFSGEIYGEVDLAIKTFRESVSISAKGHANLKGGYSSAKGLYVEGAVGASAELKAGSCNSGCNDYCTASWGYPAGFRLCIGMSASVAWSKRDGFAFRGISVGKN